jgi:hypothetical protein
MKKSELVITGLAICLAALVSPTTADTHYVDINSATPTGPYTNWATAANSIQAAVNAASVADTVLVADGTYITTSQIKVWKGLTVRSVNGPEAVTVDGGGICRVFNLKPETGPVTLEGFTISGGYSDHAWQLGGGILAGNGNWPVLIDSCVVVSNAAPGPSGGISVISSENLSVEATLRNCIVRNNNTPKNAGGIGIRLVGSGSVVVEDCIIGENSSGNDGGGIWCSAPNGSIIISRCLVWGNDASRDGGGVRLMYNAMLTDSLIADNVAGRKGGGEHGGLVGNSYIVNCTITENDAPVGGGVSKSTVFNSIVHGNRANTHPDITTNSTVAFSCSPNLPAGLNGNINDNPQLADPVGSDYRLLATSPCIDAGTNAFVLSTTDLDRNPRVVDGDLDGNAVVDMGTYEFQIIGIEIDIKPGSNTNPINLKSKGRCPVAVLTTDEFDASEIDPATVRFAGAAPVHHVLEDVDADGDIDLILHFKTQELNLTNNSSEAELIAQSYDGQLIIGADTIQIVPRK